MSEVILRALSEADTENIVKWRNAPKVRKNLYSQNELTAEQHLNYFKNVVQLGKCRQYIIVADGRDIGTIFIKNIDPSNHKGEYGIFIGEENAYGKGYSLPATLQILDIAFTELKLNRVYLTVIQGNMPAISTYKRAGFHEEGILRQDYYRDGKYYDVVMMSVLIDEWIKLYC